MYKTFNETTEENPIKVASYIRVSTDKNDQENSFKNQKEYYVNTIGNNKKYDLIDIYADEGITGTNTAKRQSFNKMIEDAKDGMFEYVIVKNIPRFARNNLDLLKYTRKLKSYNVGVYFENERIDTMKTTDEVLLSILGTLAQDKSRETSEAVKWALRKQMAEGYVMGGNRLLGYHIEDGQLSIIEDEAKLVREIYNMYTIKKMSLNGVATELNNRGIKGKRGGRFSSQSVRSILRNEKYCGDLIQQKNYIENYLTGKMVKNEGELDFFIIRDNHEPIVSRETWNLAQDIISKRALKRKNGIGVSKSPLNGKMICAICGENLRRRKVMGSKGRYWYSWVCKNSYTNSRQVCPNSKSIRDDVTKKIIVTILNKFSDFNSEGNFIENMLILINKGMESTNQKNEKKNDLANIEKKLEQIKKQEEKLVDLYLMEKISHSIYDKKITEIRNNKQSLTNILYETENREEVSNNRKQRLKKIQKVLEKGLVMENFDDSFIEEFVEKIYFNGESREVNIIMNFGGFKIDLSDMSKNIHTDKLQDENYCPFHIYTNTDDDIKDSSLKYLFTETVSYQTKKIGVKKPVKYINNCYLVV